jgi:hypothetical protein
MSDSDYLTRLFAAGAWRPIGLEYIKRLGDPVRWREYPSRNA